MATMMNGAGLPQGVVPFPGQQQGQPIVPPGQTVMSHQPARGYGVDQLPPMPQQQAQGGYGIPYGQPVQVQGGAQQGGWVAPQYPQPQPQGMPLQPQTPPLFGQQPGPQHVLPWQQPQQGTPQAPAWPQQPTWPQQVPGGPQSQVQGVQQGLDPNARLSGPGVPPELQGRTMGEALSMYNAMAANFRQQLPPRQQPIAPQPQQQGASQGAAPKPQWLEPIAQLFEQQLDARLQPMQQYMQSQAVAQGYQVAKTMIPDLAVLEAEMQQALTQAKDISIFADPNQWKNLADFARGRLMAEGRYQFQPTVAPRQVQLPGQQNVQSGAYNGQQFVPSVPASYGATAPAHTWFTESPSAPLVGGMSGVPQQPTAQDIQAAANFQVPIGEWMAWRHGMGGQQGGMR